MEMETILTKDKKQEAQGVLDLLAILNEKEKQEFTAYMQAIKFIKKNQEEFGLA